MFLLLCQCQRHVKTYLCREFESEAPHSGRIQTEIKQRVIYVCCHAGNGYCWYDRC